MNETGDIKYTYAIDDRVLDMLTSKVGTVRELPDEHGLYTIEGAYTRWTRRARATHLKRMPSLAADSAAMLNGAPAPSRRRSGSIKSSSALNR